MANHRDQNDPDDPGPNAERKDSLSPLSDPGLERVLRQAGIDTRNPEVQRTLQVISVSSITARAVLPLPPASMLAEYKEVLPDLPERFVEWTETQAAHRRELERMRAEGLENRMNRGQWGALIVAVVGLAISGAVGIFGHWLASAVIAVVSVGGPAAAVVVASNSFFGRPGSKKNGSPPPGP